MLGFAGPAVETKLHKALPSACMCAHHEVTLQSRVEAVGGDLRGHKHSNAVRARLQDKHWAGTNSRQGVRAYANSCCKGGTHASPLWLHS